MRKTIRYLARQSSRDSLLRAFDGLTGGDWGGVGSEASCVARRCYVGHTATTFVDEAPHFAPKDPRVCNRNAVYMS